MPTETLRPNAVGDKTECTPFPAVTPNWDCVDETPSDGDTTYVYHAVTAEIQSYADLHNLPATSIPVGSTINSIRVYNVVRNVKSGRGGYYTKIKTNGTEYDSSITYPAGTAWVTFSGIYLLNPFTGLAWTIDEINALQAGCGLRGEYDAVDDVYYYGRCTQVWVVIDYTLAVALKAGLHPSKPLAIILNE